MKHYEYKEWLKYVKDELDEKKREELENHLYTCDKCLNTYLQAIEESETAFPTLSDETNFTDWVMNGIEAKTEVPDTKNNVVELEKVPDTKVAIKMDTQAFQKRPFYKQAVFHYVLAAAATLLLMFSGAFQSLAGYAASIEAKHSQEKKPSVTEDVMKKTFAWMDSLEKKGADQK